MRGGSRSAQPTARGAAGLPAGGSRPGAPEPASGRRGPRVRDGALAGTPVVGRGTRARRWATGKPPGFARGIAAQSAQVGSISSSDICDV